MLLTADLERVIVMYCLTGCCNENDIFIINNIYRSTSSNKVKIYFSIVALILMKYVYVLLKSMQHC